MAEASSVPNLVDRLGAALVAPSAALADASSPRGAGRAPADLAVLILAGFAATHTVVIARAGWMVRDGDGMGAAHLVLGEMSAAVRIPLLFVVAGGLLVTLLAGKRRSLATDFDLACVAAVPLGTIPVVLELLDRVAAVPGAVESAALVLACAWGAVLLALALARTRRRPREPA